MRKNKKQLLVVIDKDDEYRINKLRDYGSNISQLVRRLIRDYYKKTIPDDPIDEKYP